MRVLITGITGNLGFEVGRKLLKKKIEIIPIVRNSHKLHQKFSLDRFVEVIETDLESEEIDPPQKKVDAILHCAGNTHLIKAKGSNVLMTKGLITLSKKLRLPLYFVGTAFTYRPNHWEVKFNNNYESDKYNSELEIKNSGIEFTLFKPSIITGNSLNGSIQNFTGYYSIVKALLKCVIESKKNKRKLLLPNFTGYSDIVTSDQVASCIIDIILSKQMGEFYITNPNPPKASWLLNETISFFNIKSDVKLIDCSFEEYGRIIVSPEEKAFFKISNHFLPYWANDWKFPKTCCKTSLISHKYIQKILTYFIEKESLI